MIEIGILVIEHSRFLNVINVSLLEDRRGSLFERRVALCHKARDKKYGKVTVRK
jgi:hypothetical protein